MKLTLSLLFAACAWFAAAPCAAQSQVTRAAAVDRPVARVNGVALTERDVALEVEALFPYFRAHSGRVPPHAEREIREKAIERVVLQELLCQEAQRRGMQVSPGVLEQRIARARRQYRTYAGFKEAVVQQHGTMEDFRRRARRALLAEMVWEQEVVRPARVTEAALRRHYQQNPEKYVRPESVRLQTISFLFGEDAGAEERRRARARAEQVFPQAKSAGSFEAFGALAERFSTDDWRVMQGDHGWVHRGTIAPELEPAWRMKPGEVSGIIASPSGFHILRIQDVRPAQQMPFAEVRESLRKTLEEQRLRERAAAYESRLRSRARIERL